MNTPDKVSDCPITIKSIDHANSISRAYYDHGRAAMIQAIVTNEEFCFNPYATNLKPVIAFYLNHRFCMGERNLPSMEEVLESINNDALLHSKLHLPQQLGELK